MAEQEKPTEARRRREPAESDGRPGEVLLWLLLPGAVLVGWAPPDWGTAGATPQGFPLRFPVQLHQVPVAASEAGAIGCAQLYTALPVDELWIERANVSALTVVPREGDIARLHGEACRQRTSSGLLLARAGGRFAH